MTSTLSRVKNSKTGRTINVGGSTYNGLIAQGYRLVGDTLYGPNAVPISNMLTSSMIPSPSVKPSIVIPSPVIPSPVIPNPSIALDIPPITSVATLPRYNPGIEAFERELMLIQAEEEREREQVCGVCKKHYMDRMAELKPFHVSEFGKLDRSVNACSKCYDLCIAKSSRFGIVNDPICDPYKHAIISGRKQLETLDTKLRVQGIRTGYNVEQFFPSVPKTQPR